MRAAIVSDNTVDSAEYLSEDGGRNSIGACDGAFASPRMYAILNICDDTVRTGFVYLDTLCIKFLESVLYATEVRGHRASHVHEDIRQCKFHIMKHPRPCL